jgi:hypothetical protein
VRRSWILGGVEEWAVEGQIHGPALRGSLIAHVLVATTPYTSKPGVLQMRLPSR